MTTPGDSNLDNIIRKNFIKPVQQKRVQKELQALKELDQTCFKVSLQSSPLGLKIIVNLTKEFILKEIPEASKFTFPILFEFLLEPKFPFVFPKLLCKTNFWSPSLSDGRDFLSDVIQRKWNPSIMLRDVVIFIPEFIKRIISLPIPEESQLIGQYYLGHLYNLEDFLSMDSVNVFSGKELINEQSVNNERYLVLAESHFLNFESVDKVRNTLRLIGWAHLTSIAKVRKNPNDENMLVFLWRDSNKKGILIQNIFILDEPKQFLTTFTMLANKYLTAIATIKKRKDLPESEVTIKNYKDIDIEELLDNIEYLEIKLEDKLNINVINLLMNLYQKAVEYFSALNDPSYFDFIEKLQLLLTREDIQMVLKSTEENAPGEGSSIQQIKAEQNKPDEEEKQREQQFKQQPQKEEKSKIEEHQKEQEEKPSVVEDKIRQPEHKPQEEEVRNNESSDDRKKEETEKTEEEEVSQDKEEPKSTSEEKEEEKVESLQQGESDAQSLEEKKPDDDEINKEENNKVSKKETTEGQHQEKAEEKSGEEKVLEGESDKEQKKASNPEVAETDAIAQPTEEKTDKGIEKEEEEKVEESQQESNDRETKTQEQQITTGQTANSENVPEGQLEKMEEAKPQEPAKEEETQEKEQDNEDKKENDNPESLPVVANNEDMFDIGDDDD